MGSTLVMNPVIAEGHGLVVQHSHQQPGEQIVVVASSADDRSAAVIKLTPDELRCLIETAGPAALSLIANRYLPGAPPATSQSASTSSLLIETGFVVVHCRLVDSWIVVRHVEPERGRNVVGIVLDTDQMRWLIRVGGPAALAALAGLDPATAGAA
jgi:hypothetical protein